MHQIGHNGLPVTASLALEVIEQAVEQGAGEVAIAGVDHQSGLFVHDEYVVVLVGDVEGNGFGQQFSFVWRFGQQDADGVAGFNLVV